MMLNQHLSARFLYEYKQNETKVVIKGNELNVVTLL